MGMLRVGQHAPEFKLRDGKGSLYALDTTGALPLTLVIFFKTTCPTCQYAWPYYERLHTAYTKAGLRVWGISQHDAERTRAFQAQYNATFPHMIDEAFTASRAYDPAFVPTSFLIDSDRTLVETVESWNARHMNALSKQIARALGVDAQEIVLDRDHAVSNKIG
jgi:peroxiredoxin